LCGCTVHRLFAHAWSVSQYTEIHRIQAQHQVEETLYRMGYRKA